MSTRALSSSFQIALEYLDFVGLVDIFGLSNVGFNELNSETECRTLFASTTAAASANKPFEFESEEDAARASDVTARLLVAAQSRQASEPGVAV